MNLGLLPGVIMKHTCRHISFAMFWIATWAVASSQAGQEALDSADEAYRVVAFGDSVTKGVRRGVKPEETFEARLEALLRPSFPKARVLNAGIGGNTTRHAWARIFSDVVEKRPGFCTLMFGINDSYFDKGRTRPRIAIEEYDRLLRGFVRLLRYHAIEPVLLTPNPMTSTVKASKREPFAGQPKGMNFMLETYCDRIRKVAGEEKAPLIDLYKMFWETGGDERGVDKLLVDGMHPNPAGHALIAEKLKAFFDKAMADRDRRPLPTPRLHENMARAKARLAAVRTWRTHAAYDASVLPQEAKPRWSAPVRHNHSMARIENGVMRFSNLDAGPKASLSFTRNLPETDAPLSVSYCARIAKSSKGAPYLSIADGRTKIWTWMTPTAFVVSRYDRKKDRIELPIDGTAFHTYRVVMADRDLYVFIDDLTEPLKIAPGWLAPAPQGRYVQLAITGREGKCDTYWKSIHIRFAGGKTR